MRILVVLACLAAVAAVPSIELRLPLGPGAVPAADGCIPHVVGPTGDLRVLDPETLEVRGPVVTVPARSQGREVGLSGGSWSHSTAIQVFEQRGTVSSIETYEAASDEWYVSLAAPALPPHSVCDPSGNADDTVYALLATGGRPEPMPGTGLPASGPSDPNVFVSAHSTNGTEQWRVPIPARAGYYFGAPAPEFFALRPAAAVSPEGRTIAVIHSEPDGSDRLSLVDARSHDVRTVSLREDRPTLRLGVITADAKMLERRKSWSPRFADERYLYAVLHETRTDELGELSVLLIDTIDVRIVARWPERGILPTVRATVADWAVADGSVYVTGRDWSQRPYTVYRLDARDLRLLARRSFEALPLIRMTSRTK